jgi:hypothetical protein
MSTTTNTATITKPLMIELEGKGPVKLQPKDYVVSGGEGAIYKPSSDIIVKLYHDKDKMRHDGMPQKLTMLSKINSPFIVNPKGLVYENQLPIGYYMKYEEGEALAKMITTSYRQRENFGEKEAIELVHNMREAVQTAHNNKAILVDANELNWIVKRKKQLVEPKLLDVDSWKIGQWDASVIMMSIRDWHTKGFDEGSDWFSWAVITFQVFAGIHPYKGGLDGFKMNDIESRMKANKSVFTPNVRLNSAVRDFNAIPGPLLDWYEAVFDHGDRSLPPSPKDISNKTPRAAMVKKAVVAKGGDVVILDKVYDGSAPIYVFPCGVVRTVADTLVDLHTKITYQKKVEGVTCEIISTQYGLLLAEIAIDNKLTFTLLTKDGKATPIESVLNGGRLVRFQNRLFVAGAIGLTEVTVKIFGAPKLVTLQMWQYLYNSTNWFHGVGVQDALGAMFLIAPFGDKSCEYIRTTELDGKRIINAMAGTRYIVAITLDHVTGAYSRHEFVFDDKYKTYAYKQGLTSTPDLNTTMLPRGVIAYIVDDGHMVIEAPTSGNVTDVKDAKIKSSFTMFNFENRVVYTDDHQVWAVSLK